MKTITIFLIIASIVLSLMAWNLFQEKSLINNRIIKASEEIILLNLEYKGLSRYKDKAPIALTRLYLDIFNNIKEISRYCNTVSAMKIPGALDRANIEHFFKASAYKGIRYVDVLYEVNYKDALDEHLLGMLYEMIKLKAVSISGVTLEKDKLTLNLRLYGL